MTGRFCYSLILNLISHRQRQMVDEKVENAALLTSKSQNI